MTMHPTIRIQDHLGEKFKVNYFRINNLQSTSLQETVRDLSLELTLLQYLLHVRVFVFSPLPHVLLQDDHAPHDVQCGLP